MEINLNRGSNSNGKKKGSGIISGLILLVLGTLLLWWNEGNNVRNIKTVTQMQKEVIEISSEQVLPENEGKLVATNGDLVVEDAELQDQDFNVSVKTPSLKRVAEMYQWKEREDTDDDGHKSYSYTKVWSETVLDIDNYNSGHTNPQIMDYKSQEYFANTVKVGAYKLSEKQIEGLPTNAELNVSIDAAVPGYTKQGIYITNAQDVEHPEIGDMRVYWKYNDWKEASVLAVPAGDSFVDFVSKYDVHINRVDEGKLTSEQLLKNQQDDNNKLKWILRAVGAFMILIGYVSLAGPLTRLANKIPVLGSLARSILTLICILLAVVHSLLIIIIAWFRYRPLLALLLLAVIIAAIILIVILISKGKKQSQGQPQQ